MKKIPRLIIAATQSGSGKTTIVSGILKALKMRGLKVQAYKVGPDYIDTGYHEIASGRSSHNLDSWLVGKDKLGEIFFRTFDNSDIAIIEGVMGLYDGGRGGISSTAEISKLLNAPVILVIDAKSMGTSAAAIALGFREFDKNVNIAGVILNRIGSDSHKNMIVDALNSVGIQCLGAIKRNNDFVLPERHLGLVPTAENNFNGVIDKICAAVVEQVDLDAMINIANTAPPLTINLTAGKCPINAKTIAVARDEAFNFYYDASLNELERHGTKIIYFSPLHDTTLPKNIDGMIIGGGFPEMFAEQLQDNKKIRAEIHAAADNGLPIFAECGGYMYLMNELVDFNGRSFEMCGVIPTRAVMTTKLQMVGYVEATLIRDCLIGRAGDIIHAHEFHFSKVEGDFGDKNIFNCKRMRTGENYLAGYADKNVVASYLHMYSVTSF